MELPVLDDDTREWFKLPGGIQTPISGYDWAVVVVSPTRHRAKVVAHTKRHIAADSEKRAMAAIYPQWEWHVVASGRLTEFLTSARKNVD